MVLQRNAAAAEHASRFTTVLCSLRVAETVAAVAAAAAAAAAADLGSHLYRLETAALGGITVKRTQTSFALYAVSNLSES